MAEGQNAVKEYTHTSLKEPHQYKVIFHNDNFTTFDFVTKVLVLVFHKSTEEAQTLTYKVDQEGQAVVGIYSYDMAVTKTEKATQMAQEEGFPLHITYEQV